MMKVSDLFDVKYGHSLELNHLTPSDGPGSVAFVSRTSKNNGVSARVEPIPDLEPIPAGTLSVALGTRNYTLETNLQLEPYYCGRDVAYLVPKKSMSDVEKLWWAKCIQANRFRFNYTRQANRTLPFLELPPSTPAWMDEIEVPVWPSRPANPSVEPLEPTTWKEFRIGEIFELRRGRNILRRDMRPGETPYVSASAVDNGISGWIDFEPDWPAGRITVSNNGSVGEAFYQPIGFIASSDVTVLDRGTPLAEGAALFICTVIRAEKYRWNYGRKWVPGRMKDSIIKLPATPSGDMDLEYAERFMRALPLSAAVL